MKRNAFQNLLSQLDSLTYNQRKILLDHFIDDPKEQSLNILESQVGERKSCPYCRSISLCRWGKSNGVQRFRCKKCSKTFNSLTGTSLSRLHHKEKWLTYCECLVAGNTLRETAKICDIDLKTSFRWRHRFLSSPAQDKYKKMTGIVEADETFFTENCKGNRKIEHRKPKKRGKSSKKKIGDRVPVLIIRDRSGTESDFVFERIERDVIHSSLKALMDDEVVLCTDGNSLYETFAKKEQIDHKRVIGLDHSFVVEKIFHIQNLNAYISRLKTWIKKFHGVATKYLENYLGWRRVMESKSKKIDAGLYLKLALKNNYQQLMTT